MAGLLARFPRRRNHRRVAISSNATAATTPTEILAMAPLLKFDAGSNVREFSPSPPAALMVPPPVLPSSSLRGDQILSQLASQSFELALNIWSPGWIEATSGGEGMLGPGAWAMKNVPRLG